MVLGRGRPPLDGEGANDTRHDPRIPGPPQGGYRFKSIAPVLNSVVALLDPSEAAQGSAAAAASSSDSLSGGAVAGIAVGAVAAAALLAGGAWLAASRRQAAARRPAGLLGAWSSGKGREAGLQGGLMAHVQLLADERAAHADAPCMRPRL